MSGIDISTFAGMRALESVKTLVSWFQNSEFLVTSDDKTLATEATKTELVDLITQRLFGARTDFCAESLDEWLVIGIDNELRSATSLGSQRGQSLMTILGPIEFEIASLVSTGGARVLGDRPKYDLFLPEVSDNLGLFLALRGRGHDMLCSRRVLDHGPFRVLRDEASDLTLMQCYDHEETDLDEVARQNDACRVYLKWCVFHRYEQHFVYELRGAYVADKREVVFVVVGRDIDQEEMQEAAAMKYYRRDDPEEPVDAVVYQFMEEDNARKHLHDLWIRGLQCWILIDGQRIRIDEDYAPVHVKPDWVVRVEEREATSGD